MSTLLYCRTDVAVLLLACQTGQSLLRFPIQSGELPGLAIHVPGMSPINDLLLAKAREVLPAEHLHRVRVVQDFVESVFLNDGTEVSLFLASVEFHDWEPPETWPTLPLMIRSMAKNKNRVPYMKALQYLASSKDDLTAIPSEELLN